MPGPRIWNAHTAEETEAVGAELANTRPPRRDALTVVYLTGDLGAGKTTLARGFLRALGVDGIVHSPSYNLMDIYETNAGPIVHLDLYRMRDPSELEPLGLRDEARPGTLWLIEWPQQGEGWLPAADVVVTLAVGAGADAGSHRVTAEAASVYGGDWLSAR
ncbi:MAG: tRNA (adenosine(37)-N6)-threonylcarbamoyltransferase complex ATPase subunit type 1 TsaE [Gammaproteobacteria bacterium]